MNIRSISGVFAPYLNKVRDKTTNSSDADRDNQSNGSGSEEKKRHLSEEDIEQILEYVRGLPGFKENNLTLRLVQESKVIVVFIEDPTGKVVRRMVESELQALFKQSQSKSPSTKGRILNKAV